MNKYRKAFVAASGVLIALGEALSDGSLDMTDGMQVLGAIALAYGVYRVPNVQEPVVKIITQYIPAGALASTGVAPPEIVPATTFDGRPKVRDGEGARREVTRVDL